MIPTFVKDSMVTCLHEAGGDINVTDVSIGGGESDEDPSEVVAI